MPIITQTTVKELLQISVDTYDSLITTLIPLVQGRIINYTHNSFLSSPLIGLQAQTFTFSPVVDSTPAYITDSDSGFTDANFMAGDYKISGSKYNNKIIQVASVTTSTLTLATGYTLISEDADSDFNVVIKKIDFPEDIQLDFSILIKYYLEKSGKLVNSESLPGVSYSYKSEQEIMKLFNRYRRLYA